ncbi:MAG: transporter associated domain-containing protein, partial [Alphaproteobacteria bacterium]|nr:transporter associated domain-containing protein [Alphaproteobacteria bacterium]
TISSELLLKILSLKNKNNVLTERELKQIIKSSADLGVINHDEKNLFNKVLEFGNLRVKNIFIYKNNVACIDILDDGDTVLNKIKKIKHNHYLVTKDNNIDNILGIIDLKDLALENMNDPKFDMQKFIKKPFVVYENFFTFKLLDIFRQHKVKIAIVVDEFGTYNGIVTMNDIVNSILISNQEQILEKIHKRTKNSWLIEGQIKMIDFAEYFKINLENLKVKDNEILTLAGYFLEQLTSAPQLGDKIKIANYQMEIIDMDGQRIDKILVHLLK